MLREIWDYLKTLTSTIIDAFLIAFWLAAGVGLVCYAGAFAISQATSKHPIQMRSNNNYNHNYPPLIIKIKTPNGETIEATAELENVQQVLEKTE
jgi:hypothetical protein